MTLPNIPPVPGADWKTWATSLRDYLMKERAQSTKATPTAPQIVHKKEGESAAQDGVLIYNPTDEELEMSVGGAWQRIIRNEIEYLDFDQSAGFVVGSGQMAWNEAAGTLDLGLNNGAVTLQIGQEIHYRVKNSSGATIPNGTVVSAAGTDGASGHILIQKFIADGSIPPRFLLGVATEDIPNGTLGYVTHFGSVDLNTSGFASGAVLYPSATVAGALTSTPPVSPDYEMPIAYAINSKNNGQIFVRIQTGYNIDELYDVQIDTPADGDFLRYVGADGRWENVPLADVLTFNDTTGYAPTAADGQIGDATLPIRNIANTADDFVQILFSLHTDNTLLARIAALRHEVGGVLSSELAFVTEAAGVLGERMRIDRAGNIGLGTNAPVVRLHTSGDSMTTGVAYKAQTAQTSKSAAATLTIAELLTGIIEYTGAADNLTLPTGTAIEGGLPATFPINMSFDVSVINTGSDTVTVVTNTGLTTVGALTVAAGSSGVFRFRKTATNTYTVYRVS